MREFEYILMIAKEKTISRAAEKLFISQPALSRYLKKTERKLGINLFEPVGKELHLTYAGERYVKAAEQIEALWGDFQTELSDIRHLKKGAISIGFPIGRGKVLASQLLPLFNEKYPEFEVNIYQESTAKLKEMLLDGTVQVIEYMTDEPLKSNQEKYDTDLISIEEIILVVSKNKKIHGQKKEKFLYPWVDLKDFSGERFLKMKESSRLRSLTDGVLKQYEMTPRSMELATVDTIWSLVKRDFGIAFVTDFNCEISAEKCDFFSFGEKPLQWNFVVSTRKGSYRSKPVRDLIMLTKELFGD